MIHFIHMYEYYSEYKDKYDGEISRRFEVDSYTTSGTPGT